MATTPCDILDDLAKAGGHLVEMGSRKYEKWATEMRKQISPDLSDTTLQRTWATIRADLAASAPIRLQKQSAVFVDALGKRLGREKAASFTDTMDEQHPEIFEKLVKGEQLTEAERKTVVGVYSQYTRRGAGTPPASAGMGEIHAAMRESAKEIAKQRGAERRLAAAPGRAARRQAAAVADAQKSAEAKLQDMTDLFPERTSPTRQSLLPAAVKAYRDGAQDLAKFARSMKKAVGDGVDDATMKQLFTDAAQKYRQDYKQLDPIKEALGSIMAREAYKNAPWYVKAKAGADNVAGASRAILTSFDLSAPLRQGALLTFANPRLARHAFADMVKAVPTHEAAQALDIALRTRPNADLYEKAKLFLSDIDNKTDLKNAEEFFRTNLAQKIPGIGRIVGASERAYVTYLNRLRVDSFDMFVRDLTKNGYKPTDHEYAAIADFINNATGRGTGRIADSVANLGGALFAPRYLISQFKTVTGTGVLHGPGTLATRKLAARTYLQAAGTLSAIYSLATLAGGDVETDTKSSYFGKIRFGNLVVDPTGGKAGYLTFLARFLSGKSTTAEGEEKQSEFGDLVGSFERGKASPIASSIIDLRSRNEEHPYGRNFVGKGVEQEGGPVTDLLKAFGKDTPDQMKALDYYFTRNAIPMNAGDIASAASAEGQTKPEAIRNALVVSILAGLGAGTRTLSDEEKSTRESRPVTGVDLAHLLRKK